MPWLFNKAPHSSSESSHRNFLFKNKAVFIGLQIVVFVALLALGISVAAASIQDESPGKVFPSDASTYEMLQATSEPIPHSPEGIDEEEVAETSTNGGGRDPKVQKIFDDMAACMAVQNARNDVLRGYSMRANTLNDLLNNLPPINFDPNQTPEQNQALIDERNALQESFRAEISAINSEQLAYEQSSGGGACWQGGGPVPR